MLFNYTVIYTSSICQYSTFIVGNTALVYPMNFPQNLFPMTINGDCHCSVGQVQTKCIMDLSSDYASFFSVFLSCLVNSGNFMVINCHFLSNCILSSIWYVCQNIPYSHLLQVLCMCVPECMLILCDCVNILASKMLNSFSF